MSQSSAEIQLTNHQRAELRYRGRCNILSAGGRGSGKSRNLVHALLAHCEEFGADARPIVFREERNALLQLMDAIYRLVFKVFGDAHRNLNDGTITLPSGAVILLSNISDESTYARLQGMTFTGMFCDEVGNYHPNAFAFMQRVRSNLRVSPGRRPEIHWTANPHGRSHSVLFKGWISKAPPWHPFDDAHGNTWVWTHSTLDSNHFIDREDYRRNLLASTGSDTALAQAWIDGLWGTLGGNMFDVFEPAVHIVANPPACRYTHRVGADWGTAAPAVALLLGRVPSDVQGYAPGSIVVLDEVDTVADPNDLSQGNGAPPQMFAEMILEMGSRWAVPRPTTVLDDARGLGGETVVGIMRENGLSCYRPYKRDRVGGWVLIRSMLAAARSGDGPGLYIASKCAHLIETLPEAPRGTLRPEDVDPKWPKDHWLDALSYGLRDLVLNRGGAGTTWGMW